MSNIDSVTQGLMAKGAPFEVIEDQGIRLFKNAPLSLSDFLETARQYATAEFIVAGELRLTYSDFFNRVDALASYLQDDCSLAAGQSVAICMKNSAEWMIAFVAILTAGGTAVLINSRGTGSEMVEAAESTNCILVIADEKRLQLLTEATINIQLLSANEMNNLSSRTPAKVSRGPQDTAAMFFTSGTTGRSKAAMISHRSLVTGTMNTQLAMAAVFQKMAEAHGIDIETLRKHIPQSCSLLIFPLFHTSGCSAVFLNTLLTGGKLVLMEKWHVEDALKLIETEKVTTLGGVPTMFWDILQYSHLSSRDLSSIVSLSCGGQALPINLLNAMRAAFPKAFIGVGYGMTETSGAVAQANGETFLNNPQASGQILPMMDVQIMDDHGNQLLPNQVGEIWVKGATLMKGYYGEPEKTAESMSGSWFKTGDIGKIDKDGYLYIADRKTDMVISGGENIYCAEVEQAMGLHPSVTQVAAFGVPDDRLGERVVASVVLSDMCEVAAIEAFVSEHLAEYKVPKEIVVSSAPFPLNVMGKIDKKAVRSSFLDS